MFGKWCLLYLPVVCQGVEDIVNVPGNPYSGLQIPLSNLIALKISHHLIKSAKSRV